jgi:outer membrane protein OmpA-like peptidoglycan-associated protein
MTERTATDSGPIRFITEAWPLLALGVVGAVIVRACVPAQPAAPAPAAVVAAPADPQAQALADDQRALSALGALGADATAAQALDALNLVAIDFASRSSQLPESAAPVLEAAARAIRARPAPEQIEVTGRVDAGDGAGSPLSDLELARRRAQCVVDFLVNQGVPAQRLQAHADSGPAPGDTATQPGSRARSIQFAALP